MNAIYFPLVPRDPQAQKDQRPSAIGITGSAVYIAGFFEALVRHSTVDAIYVPDYPRGRPDDPRSAELFTAHPGRIRSLAEHQLGEMAGADRLVLTAPFQSMAGMLRIRRLLRRPRTPITAIIHSINSAHQMASMLELYLSPVESFDALVCSSTAGRQAIVKFQQTIERRLSEAGVQAPRTRVRTPVLPLGVETADFVRTDGAELRRSLSIDAHQRVVLYFGRFSPSSKADLLPLLIAFADLARLQPAAVLVLAGDDTHFRMAGDLTQFAAQLGCGDRVRIVPNPTGAQRVELYRLAEVFVSLSDNLQETFGLSVVEAMAAGLPVVASDWDGYRDLVIPEETGYLIPTFLPDYPPAFDDVRGSGRMLSPDLLAATTVVDIGALTRALDLLFTDVDHRLQLGAAGQRRARATYDWRAVIRAHEALWSDLQAEAHRDGSAPAAVRPDWTSWGYREIFGHYGTGFITPAMRLRITDRGREWRLAAGMLERIAVPASWFTPDGMAQVLDRLADADGTPIDDLLAGGEARDGDRVRALGEIFRLMKYGLVAPLDARAVQAALRSGTAAMDPAPDLEPIDAAIASARDARAPRPGGASRANV